MGTEKSIKNDKKRIRSPPPELTLKIFNQNPRLQTKSTKVITNERTRRQHHRGNNNRCRVSHFPRWSGAAYRGLAEPFHPVQLPVITADEKAEESRERPSPGVLRPLNRKHPPLLREFGGLSLRLYLSASRLYRFLRKQPFPFFHLCGGRGGFISNWGAFILEFLMFE